MKKNNLSDKILIYFAYAYMLTFAILAVLPFLAVLSASITSEKYIMLNGFSLLPHEFSLKAYSYILGRNSSVYRGYIITIAVTVSGTLLSMLVTSMLAFALSRKQWKLSNPLSLMVFFTMLFSGGLVPWYLMTSHYLHLHDSIMALFIPYTVNAFNLLILKNFFSMIDNAILESARIDGANDFRLLSRIILPLSMSGLATISLFYALGYWNDWWLALMLINKHELYPLQYLLRMILSSISYASSKTVGSTFAAAQIPSEGVKMATTIVTIGPIIFLYPFLQRYFIKGLTVGGVKG